MNQIEITKYFNDAPNICKAFYELVAEVFKKHKEGGFQASGLYWTNQRSNEIFCYGSMFNGKSYAEVDFYPHENGPMDSFLNIGIFGGDNEELKLMKSEIEKGLEGLTKNGN